MGGSCTTQQDRSSSSRGSALAAGFATPAIAADAPPVQPAAAPHVRVAIAGGRWHINGAVTYRGAPAEGLLLNVRMVNAVFEDRAQPDFDPEANTDEFLAHLPDYAAHGVRAFTLCLQGGMPGYEGAVNSAFDPDGSLREPYLDARPARHRGVRPARRWSSSSAASTSGRTRSWPTRPPCAPAWSTSRAGFGAAASATSCSRSPTSSGTTASTTASPKTAAGQVELIRLAATGETARGLLVSTSGLGDGRLSGRAWPRRPISS